MTLQSFHSSNFEMAQLSETSFTFCVNSWRCLSQDGGTDIQVGNCNIPIFLSFVYAACEAINHVVEHDVANNDSMVTPLYTIS
jgi:hypothetical protein